jgi:uncharacterized SAM-binding protein YcdF (DUF218 family)
VPGPGGKFTLNEKLMILSRKAFARYSALLLKSSVFSMLLGACSYSARSSRKLLDQSAGKTYDVIVVPGVPLEGGKWSRTMKGRIYWAKYLYDKGYTKNIIFSGAAVYTPYYEGEVMAMYAIALGIPKEHVFSETRAEHSTENIYYSHLKAKQLGFRKVALASDPFQTKLLRRFTRRRVGKDVAMLPMVLDTMKMLQASMADPTIDFTPAYKNDFISIKQKQGIFKRLKGTLGYNIKDSIR